MSDERDGVAVRQPAGEHLDLLVHDVRVERMVFYKGLLGLALTVGLAVVRQIWWV